MFGENILVLKFYAFSLESDTLQRARVKRAADSDSSGFLWSEPEQS